MNTNTKRIFYLELNMSSPDFIPVTNTNEEVDGENIVYTSDDRYFSPALERQNAVSDDDSLDSLQEDVCAIETKMNMFTKLTSLNNETLKVLQSKMDSMFHTVLCNESVLLQLAERFEDLAVQIKGLTSELHTLRSRVIVLEQNNHTDLYARVLRLEQETL